MGGLVEPGGEPPVVLAASTVVGTAGADTLTGTLGIDLLYGLGGDDVLGSADFLSGPAGKDTLYGGDGNDLFNYRTGYTVFGGAGLDTVWMDLSNRDLGRVINLVNPKGLFHDVEAMAGRLTSHNDVLAAGAFGLDDASIGGDIYGGAGVDRFVMTYNYDPRVTGIDLLFDGTEMSLTLQNGSQSWTAASRVFEFEDYVVFGSTGADYIDLASGNNLVLSKDGNDTVYGGTGSDTISGGLGNDTVYGGSGSDKIYGNSGDDYLAGGGGNDTIHGGDGNDTIVGITSDDTARGGNGMDQAVVDYSASSTGVDLGQYTHGRSAFIEYYYGVLSPFADAVTLRWEPIVDPVGTVLDAGQGIDRLDMTFHHLIFLGFNFVTFDNNLLTVSSTSGQVAAEISYINFDVFKIRGSDGNDYIETGALNDTLIGMAGDDTVNAGGGADWVQGRYGDDYLIGDPIGELNPGNDTLDGSYGNDTMFGGGGNDWFNGGFGNDVIEGGDGNDSVVSGQGDDRFDGGLGDDRLLDEGGNDTVSGDGGNDTIDGGNGADFLFGGDGLDRIYGGANPDLVFGGAGNDSLIGGNGNDTIQGNAGIDLLEGGLGADSLSGGDGADVFIFDVTVATGADFIQEYRPEDRLYFYGDLQRSDITVTDLMDGNLRVVWANGALVLEGAGGDTVAMQFGPDPI